MIKRFTADNSRAALALVRGALGPEAVILANRRVGEQVELLATCNLDTVMEEGGEAAPEPLLPHKPEAEDELSMGRLESELSKLRGMLEAELQQRSWRDVAGRPARDTTLRQRLRRMGVLHTLADSLLQDLPDVPAMEVQWRTLLARLADKLAFADEHDAPRCVACVGTTGVGKTATVARLAVRAKRVDTSQSIGVISMECFGNDRSGQLELVARRFDLKFVRAASVSELVKALRDMDHCARVYIDTTGLGQRDPRIQEQVRILLELYQPVAIYAVLSAAAQPAQNRELLAAMQVSGVVVTKVDESIVLGGVLDAVIRARVPLLYYSRGQRVPEDLEVSVPEELVALAEKLSRPPPANSAVLRDGVAQAIA